MKRDQLVKLALIGVASATTVAFPVVANENGQGEGACGAAKTPPTTSAGAPNYTSKYANSQDQGQGSEDQGQQGRMPQSHRGNASCSAARPGNTQQMRSHR